MSKKTQVLWGLVVFLILVAVDQLAKILCGNVYHNFFFAFSLKVPAPLMYVVYFIGIASIAAYLFKHHQNLSKTDFLAWTMILAGAVSNVGERIVLGYVRDWIHIKSGVFNLADGYIILGILILLIGNIRKK